MEKPKDELGLKTHHRGKRIFQAVVLEIKLCHSALSRVTPVSIPHSGFQGPTLGPDALVRPAWVAIFPA